MLKTPQERDFDHFRDKLEAMERTPPKRRKVIASAWLRIIKEGNYDKSHPLALEYFKNSLKLML